MGIRTISIICAMLIVSSGCGRKQGEAEMAMAISADEARGRNQVMAAKAAPAEPAIEAESGAVQAGDPLGVLAASTTDRYLIKMATITLESKDVEQALAQLTQSIVGVGGYVAGLTEHVDGLGRRAATVTVRVPADQFDSAVMHLDPLGKILQKQVTTEDVTEAYVDTDAQARNLKKMEERILAHLDRAGTLEEVLKVEQELTRVRDQIERLDGRLRYLGNRIAYSTLQVSIQKAPDAEPLIPAHTFSVAQTFSQSFRGVVELLQGLLVIVIRLAVWSIVWIPVALVLYLLARMAQKHTAKRRLTL